MEEIDNEDSDSDSESIADDEAPADYQLPWMQEAGRYPNQIMDTVSALGMRDIDVEYDWLDHSAPLESILDASKWLEDQVKLHPNDVSQELPFVDYQLLKGEQRTVFLQVMAYFKKILQDDGTPPPPILCINIDGTAGTGKSFLIWAISSALRDQFIRDFDCDPVVRMAPTGIAAYGIRGWTLNFALSIPVHKGWAELSNSALARLQHRWQKVKLLIIDEKSMVGRRTMGKADRQLCQIFPENADEILGGMSCLLFGDFAQLPPVGDLPLLSD